LPFLLFNSLYSFSQPGSKFENSFRIQAKTDTLFNKKEIIIRNVAKDTIEISGFRNGKLHGKQVLFYGTKDVKKISNYKNGLLNGKVEYFVQNSQQLLRIEHYKAIPKEGKSVLNGKVLINYHNAGISEELIYKNGEKSGKYTLYHQNGQIKEKGTFQEGLNIGKKNTYANNGNLLRDENFIIIDNPKYIKVYEEGNNDKNESSKKEMQHIPEKLSVLDGRVRYFHYNGLVASDAHYKKGLKEGLSKEYHQNATNTIKSEVIFKNGLEHGSFIHYDNDGKIERKGIYYREISVGDTIYKNVYDGEIVVYNRGKLQRIENWKDFKKNGVQEDYSYHTGKLSQRYHFKDNLKDGIEERFDADGLKIYEGHFEIVEKDGKKVSQQTGLETAWNNGKIRYTTEWKNGQKNGITRNYYENGQLERIMHFENGNLTGPYVSYFENGQLKEDYQYQLRPNSSSKESIGWNSQYEENGDILRRFYGNENGENDIALTFENGKQKEISVENGIYFKLSNDKKIESISFSKSSRPYFGYDFFSNQKVRRIHFHADKHNPSAANFTSDGQFIQIYSITGQNINNEKLEGISKKVATQYNPNWNEESLITNGFKDGIYEWKYADRSPFFRIEFKDSLPNGTWLMFNPINGDTIYKKEYESGKPIGKWLEKTIDGVVKSRVCYHENYKVRENYSYANEGKIREIKKYDTLGNEMYFADYFENGQLKSMREPLLSNYLYMTESGDTSSYRFLIVDKDSIQLERQFYKENLLKLERRNNLTTGLGEVKTFHENGQLNTLHELKDKKSSGIYKKFDLDGKLLTLGHFKEGKRHGQWINYDVNGDAEISQFENGEIIIDKSEEDPNSCKCYDQSLPSGKIGFAGLLSHLEEYDKVKDFIPKKIIPIDGFNYDNIFYVNLQTDNNRSAGFTSLKLLMFKEFSFHYPVENYLKFTLNPCKTEGYISNIDGNFHYSYLGEKTLSSHLSTKTIAVGLQNNPLVNAKNKSLFTVLFETDGIDFDEKDIKNIRFINEDSTCYPLGIINDLIEIEILKAQLDIRPSNGKYYNVPLLPTEASQFYGFDISEANLSFNFLTEDDITLVKANTDRILAGANYVAGRINIEGKPKDMNEFILKDGKKTVKADELQRFLENQGFYRVKIKISEENMSIEFYIEK